MKKICFLWLCSAAILISVALVQYFGIKHAWMIEQYRQSDILLQQVYEALETDQSLASLSIKPIALETSEQCFVIVYDEVNAIRYNTATLDEQPAVVPLSIALASDGEPVHEVWTPMETKRFVISTRAYANGHIVVGQSMKQYEQQLNAYQQTMLYMTGFAVIAMLPILLLLKKAFHIHD